MPRRPAHPSDPQMIPGEPLRWLVMSRSDNKQRLVDLSEFDGHGKCDCQHFVFRLLPLLERGAYHHESLECYHIRKAKRWFCRMMQDAFMKQNGEKVKT